MAGIIDGKAIAQQIKEEVRKAAHELRLRKGVIPGLAFVIVGENPASLAYVRMKGKACEEIGFYSVTERLPVQTGEAEVLRLLEGFNRDGRIHGILVQLPLPSHLDEGRILTAIDPRKDVDGFHPINVGKLVTGQPCFKPCTPLGVQELLLRSGHDPGGKHVVVVGRSNIVGKPVMNMLLQKERGANAVVTIAHTGAPDLSIFTKQADILITAMGRAECVTGAMIRPGAVVIDVGMNRVEDANARNGYRLVGDVHFASAVQVAGAITPVPGGVGPMTIAMLMRNTLEAAVLNS